MNPKKPEIQFRFRGRPPLCQGSCWVTFRKTLWIKQHRIKLLEGVQQHGFGALRDMWPGLLMNPCTAKLNLGTRFCCSTTERDVLPSTCAILEIWLVDARWGNFDSILRRDLYRGIAEATGIPANRQEWDWEFGSCGSRG